MKTQNAGGKLATRTPNAHTHTHTLAHTHTHTHTRARTQARTHAHTYTHPLKSVHVLNHATLDTKGSLEETNTLAKQTDVAYKCYLQSKQLNSRNRATHTEID